MERIVVGVDGSAGADNAMRWADRLAQGFGAELIVMTSFVPTDSELPPNRVEVLTAECQSRLETWIAAAGLDVTTVRTVVERGDPRPALQTVAEHEDADLIVIGRIGTSSGPGLLHVGSLAEWLAHNADRPIAVVGGAVHVTTDSVLVGIDGSEGSRAALAWVADLGDHVPLRVVGASVDRRPADPTVAGEQWRDEVEKMILAAWAEVPGAREAVFQPLALRAENAADSLLQAAKDERTDIIVVGVRGLGGFTGLRVGGVALKVLHRVDRPVVLVPPA